MDFKIEQREVPARMMLSERQHHVRQADLPATNVAALGRVSQAAQRYGGAAGLLFTIFHDEEYDESDINFEVCAPLGEGVDASADPEVRLEPAHREAYVRLTKAQAMPPAIGQAYAAVGEWVRSNGYSVAFGPREVYFADPVTAAADDELLELAFPIR